MKRKYLYFHTKNGSIVQATKSEAKKLPGEFERIHFTTNAEGKRIMRFKFKNGGATATVDVSENVVEKEPENGNTDTN